MTVERNHAITLVLVSRQSFENRSIKFSFIFVSTPLKLRLNYESVCLFSFSKKTYSELRGDSEL